VQRPHEHDRGLAHDMHAMLTRRRALYLTGIAGASALAACASGGTQQAPASPSAEATSTSDTACAAAAPQETARQRSSIARKTSSALRMTVRPRRFTIEACQKSSR
jgi:hypothetical protein